MADAPVPAPSLRNPFSFGPATRTAHPAPMHDGMVHATIASDSAPALLPPSLPALTLMGIAEETTASVTRRTAVIAGEGDALYMVTDGQAVGSRYKVTRIGVDAVELEDLLTKGYRRIAMR
jgi:Tfp pilus assembly protein PilP